MHSGGPGAQLHVSLQKLPHREIVALVKGIASQHETS